MPTLEGKNKIEVPEGTPSGKIIKLKNQGAYALNSNARGDQLCKVVIDVPRGLDEKQKAKLQDFARSLGQDTAGDPKKFMSSIKGMFK